MEQWPIGVGKDWDGIGWDGHSKREGRRREQSNVTALDHRRASTLHLPVLRKAIREAALSSAVAPLEAPRLACLSKPAGLHLVHVLTRTSPTTGVEFSDGFPGTAITTISPFGQYQREDGAGSSSRHGNWPLSKLLIEHNSPLALVVARRKLHQSSGHKV
jgi:hypothetical protein